jgi:hypothetical protein
MEVQTTSEAIHRQHFVDGSFKLLVRWARFDATDHPTVCFARELFVGILPRRAFPRGSEALDRNDCFHHAFEPLTALHGIPAHINLRGGLWGR